MKFQTVRQAEPRFTENTAIISNKKSIREPLAAHSITSVEWRRGRRRKDKWRGRRDDEKSEKHAKGEDLIFWQYNGMQKHNMWRVLNRKL